MVVTGGEAILGGWMWIKDDRSGNEDTFKVESGGIQKTPRREFNAYKSVLFLC